MKFYNRLLEKIILPLGDRFYGQPMMNRLNFLEQAQYFNEQKLQELQKAALMTTLREAATVPMYKELYRDAGASLTDITNVSDLHKLPIVSKEMLRNNFPERSTRKTGQKVYQISTSGSTGKNLFLVEDNFTAGWYRAAFLLGQTWSGWQFGEPHLQTGMTLNRGFQKRLKDHMLNCHYFSAFDLSDEKLDAMLSVIERKRINYIWGYPGSLDVLAQRAFELGWNRPLIAASTWGDTLSTRQRDRISNVFSAQVFDSYGVAEGVQIAAQCEEGNYHIMMLDTVLEILDENDKPVKESEIGRVVLTRLHAGASPLIRYEVGDLAMSAGNKICPCGRTFPLLGGVYGRESDLIYSPEGNRLIVHFFTGILEHFKSIESFQIHQSELESITLLLVPSGQEEINQNQIKKALDEKGTGGLSINIEIVDEIPLNKTGKRKFVINTMSENERF